MHIPNETAGTITALFDLTTIRVINSVTKISITYSPLHQQYLIASDAKMTVGQQSTLRWTEAHGLIHRINHDEVIAQSLHFSELKSHQ
jgi:hypothetical protein